MESSNMIRNFFVTILLAAASTFFAEPSMAQKNNDPQVQKKLQSYDWPPSIINTAIGVTRLGTTIPALLNEQDFDFNTPKTRILLVAGLDGSKPAVSAALKAFHWFHTSPEAKRYRDQFVLSSVPIANPDGWAGGTPLTNQSGGKPYQGYPPPGSSYNQPKNPEAAYLWRWTLMSAPDLVVDIRQGKSTAWFVPKFQGQTFPNLKGLSPRYNIISPGKFSSELFRSSPTDAVAERLKIRPVSASIPAIRLDTKNSEFLKTLLQSLSESNFPTPSPARKELQQRTSRSAIQVATELSKVYGQELSSPVYTKALSLVARIRLDDLLNQNESLSDVERIVAPYTTGKKQALTAKNSGSVFAGHLIFAELASRTGKKRYIELVAAVADRGFNSQGNPLPAMPAHSEMSDAVFMSCPILVAAGKLTGDQKYYDFAITHMQFMRNLNVRENGLHRHSPLDETPWGRGNGFPALGLAWSLTDLPKTHAGREAMEAAFKEHLQALLKYQDPNGMWHQVVNHEGSYREMTSTCMITFAMIRGVRLGILKEADYQPAITKAWTAIKSRITPTGVLVDVCTGTGKQKNLRGYFDRTAILGKDDRGGAMAITVSVEMATWQQEQLRDNNK